MAQFIASKQPLLSLHGHIHESPDVTGVCTARIGRTTCHQPGQRLPTEVTFSVVSAEGMAVTIERHVVALRR